MRSLRSRVIEDASSSASTTTYADEVHNVEEQTAKRRKSKKIKTKKTQKLTSVVNEVEQQGNFVLLRSRKSMTIEKKDEDSRDPKNKSADSQMSKNDNNGVAQIRNAQRMKRKGKRSINQNEFSPKFENAITSTIMKPKKGIKFISAGPVNQNSSENNSKEENSSIEKQKKKQKKGKRKQKISVHKDETQADKSGTVLLENQHNFVRAPKHDVTNSTCIVMNNTNTLIDNTTFDADNASETMNESTLKKKEFIALIDRESDVISVSTHHATFDKTNDDGVKIDNTTFDAEIPKSSKMNRSPFVDIVTGTCAKINGSIINATNTNSKIPSRPNVLFLDIQKNVDDDEEYNTSTLNVKDTQTVSITVNKNTNHEYSKMNCMCYEIEETETKVSTTNVSIAKIKTTNQEYSAIDNGTFEIEDSFKTREKMEGNHVKSKSIHEDSSKINDGTFEMEENPENQNKNKTGHVSFVFGNKNAGETNISTFKITKTPYINRKTKSERRRSALTNQTIEDEDESSEDEKSPDKNREIISKKTLFENESSIKEYVNLDDISDVELDEIINISDDTPRKSNLKQNTFNLSNEESNNTFTKTVEEEGKSETFDVSVRNQSGEWQVQDLTKRIKDESYVDKTQFGTGDVFAVDNETMDVDNEFPAKNFSLLNETNNLLTPNDKSTRKKWQKFARNSRAANSVLEQINTPAPKKELFATRRSFMTNTPRVTKNTTIRQYSSPMPEPSRKSLAKNKSLLASCSKLANKEVKSIKKNTSMSKHDTSKGVVKRIAMPNFALIHQKAFEKMESLQEFSERKRQRANLLLSLDKRYKTDVSKVTDNKENVKKKSSRELFTDNLSKDCNRFGFKVRSVPVKKQSPIDKKKTQNNTATSVFKTSYLPKPKLIIPKSMMLQDIGVPIKKQKAPVFERKDVQAIANKKKVENVTKGRENRRDQLKGVRTNRRFELLMKMRNNQ